MAAKVLRILGTRGIPASHGGFETFAEHLALHLQAVGWRVIVYCQEDGTGPIFSDQWRGVERVVIPIDVPGPRGTMLFDWLAICHASKSKALCLTLGYNTAVFCALLRLRGVPNLINMDGIEWARAKWSVLARLWFWMNDWLGCWMGNHLVADHPEIKVHLSSRTRSQKITMIPYGADEVVDASVEPLESLGLMPGRFLTVIARPEPENSILEIVQGFSAKLRGVTLAVLGRYDEANAYHLAVKGAASSEVRFVGAIYDKPILHAIRFHCAAYVHGHQVGGTNPSLVEALGAGNAVIAHDNRFNRWVAGDNARYFTNAGSFSLVLDDLLAQPEVLRGMRLQSKRQFQNRFTWPMVLGDYERLLQTNLPA